MLKFIYLLKEELRRMLIFMKRYWMEQVSMVLQIYMVFVLMMLMGGAIGGQTLSNADKGTALVGILVWQLSMGAIGILGWSFFNEASSGTLEHLCLSPMGITTVFLARSVADFLTNLITMLATAVLSMLTVGVRLHLPIPELLVLLPLTLVGMYGVGFIIAAATLTFRRTQQIIGLLQFVFLFFAGSAVPLDRIHPALNAIGQLLPLTAGITAMRKVTVDNVTLAGLSGPLLQVTITSAVWLALGLGVYVVADRRARLRGGIGQY